MRPPMEPEQSSIMEFVGKSLMSLWITVLAFLTGKIDCPEEIICKEYMYGSL